MVELGAVVAGGVVIGIVRAEVCAIMDGEAVARCSVITLDVQPVVGFLTVHPEVGVVGVVWLALVDQVDPQLRVDLETHNDTSETICRDNDTCENIRRHNDTCETICRDNDRSESACQDNDTCETIRRDNETSERIRRDNDTSDTIRRDNDTSENIRQDCDKQ